MSSEPTITLMYETTVYVCVDLATSEVISVSVDDEGAKLKRDAKGRPEYVEGTGQPPALTQAVEIAESGMWPAWEFGF